METWTLNDKHHNSGICIVSPSSGLAHCPVCMREYLKENSYDLLKCTKFYDYNNIICKCYFSDNVYFPIIEPMQIFTFCCKCDLTKYNGKFYADKEWNKRMRISVSLLIPLYEDETYKDPLILYVCDNKEGSLNLRTKKPFNENDIINHIDVLKYLRQSPFIIDEYIDEMIM